MTQNHVDPVHIDEFLQWKPVMPQELIGKGVLYSGGKAVVYGRYKRFKSMLVLWMLSRMRSGHDILGLPTPTNGAAGLYLQGEISEPLLWKRASSMWTGATVSNGATPPTTSGNGPAPLYIWSRADLKLDDDNGYGLVRHWLRQLAPIDILVVDPLYKFISGDITSPVAVTAFQDNLDKLINEFNIGVLIVAHPRKPGVQDNINAENTDDLLGSSTWSNWPDSVLKIVRPSNAPEDTFVLKADVLRHAEEEIADIAYTIDRKTLQFHVTILV